MSWGKFIIGAVIGAAAVRAWLQPTHGGVDPQPNENARSRLKPEEQPNTAVVTPTQGSDRDDEGNQKKPNSKSFQRGWKYVSDAIKVLTGLGTLALLFLASEQAATNIRLAESGLRVSEALARMQMDQANELARQSAERDRVAAERTERYREQERNEASATYARENRARVLLAGIGVDALTANEPVRLTVRFRNDGKTDAANYQQIGWFDWFPAGQPSPITANCPRFRIRFVATSRPLGKPRCR
jgi:hypothetical protein